MTGDITNPADIEGELDRLYQLSFEHSNKMLVLGSNEGTFKLAAEKLYADAFLAHRKEGGSVAESEQVAKLAALEMSKMYELSKNERQDRRTVLSVIDRNMTALMAKMKESRP